MRAHIAAKMKTPEKIDPKPDHFIGRLNKLQSKSNRNRYALSTNKYASAETFDGTTAKERQLGILSVDSAIRVMQESDERGFQ